jgi:hypothetical protein
MVDREMELRAQLIRQAALLKMAKEALDSANAVAWSENAHIPNLDEAIFAIEEYERDN